MSAIEADWIINPSVDANDNQAWDCYLKGKFMFNVVGSADMAWSRIDDYENPIGPIKNAEGINLEAMGFKIKGKVR